MAKKEAAKVQENKTVELPTAKDVMKQIAQKEAEKASEYVRREAAAEREKKALMERLGKASGLSDEEALRRATDPASLLERIDRSAGAPFSKQPVYGWRSRDQQLGARVG